MLAVTSCEKAAAKLFKVKLKSHLQHLAPQSRAVVVRGNVPGAAVSIPESDVTHVFDLNFMLAVSHAIEDLAAEVKDGELISTFPHFDCFEPQKKQYSSLAKDLRVVRVWGSGKPPARCPGIDFVQAEDPGVLCHRLVLFDSPDCRALLMCKPVNAKSAWADRKFVGFYSFNPYLVQSVRWRFNLLSSGLGSLVKSYEKLFPLPSLKMRNLDEYLEKACCCK